MPQHVAELQRGYERALTEAGLDAVTIHSGSLQPRTRFDDQFWPLRPTPHFQHWLPLAEPDCALLDARRSAPAAGLAQAAKLLGEADRARRDHWLSQFEIVEIEEAADARAAPAFRRGGWRSSARASARAASWRLADA